MAQSAPATASWHLVTGEYPPQPGGVSDYTQHLGQALCDSGEKVHIWAPKTKSLRTDAEIIIHELPGFGPAGLRVLSSGLKAIPGRRRLLVQYAASAYGFRGMNLPFAFWLANWDTDEVWVHFHEVAYGFSWRQRPRRNVLAAVEWWMAQLAAGRAERIFISVPGWRRQLGRYAERAELLPIPSNIPSDVNLEDVRGVRIRLGSGPLVGHFGTYGPLIAGLLEPVIALVLNAARDARFLLLGRGGPEFAGRFASMHPDLASRVIAPGSMDATSIASHLAACDVGFQPYPDGISGRRTSAMAGLALRKPIVTTSGHLTESDWARSAAVVLVPVGQTDGLARAVLRLLYARDERETVGAGARALYEQRFSMARTLESLGLLNVPGRLES